MARVLAISSQVVFGNVGLSAIVPALQADGHDVLALPTVLLSNHPGLGKPTGGAINVEALIAGLQANNALTAIDAVLTGYFSNAAQVGQVAALVAALKCKTVLVDPILGDGGRLYVPEDVAHAIRDQLLPLATTITPNLFELSWLTGGTVSTAGEAIEAARTLKLEEVVATSVPSPGTLSTLRITADDVQAVDGPNLDHVPRGTGDYFSGLYLARLLKEPREVAFQQALAKLNQTIGKSLGQTTLKVS
jgi:pyridoxine kinase